MNNTLNRRNVLLGGASAILSPSLLQRPAQAFDILAGAAGIGVALFPPAALALAGFGLVKGIGLVSNANGLVNDAKTAIQNLETHIDTVLNQVSGTLATVQQFVQDCDTALHNVETLVEQLPSALSAAFSAAQTKFALGKLQGDTANMSSYLNSKNSIFANRTRIQNLCESIVDDISQLNVQSANSFQFVMQTIPSITTWMQGYTAYNLLLDGSERSTDPWNHPTVASMVLPKAKSIVQSIKDQAKLQGQTGSNIPLNAGVLYTFDGERFAQSNRRFAASYTNGEIDNGLYYAIWPEGVAWQHGSSPPGPPNMPPFPEPIGPRPGDLVFLSLGPSRFWVSMPPSTLLLTPPNAPPAPPGMPPLGPPPDLAAAVNVAGVYPRLLSSTLKTTLAFDSLSEGWQVFEKATNTYLATSDKDIWLTMPRLVVT